MVLVDDEAEQVGKAWNIPAMTAFTTPQQFIEWWESAGREYKGPLVIDLHISPYINGLDILREVGQRPETYLSSSEFMNLEMLEAVRGMGVRVVPKQVI